MSSSSLQIAFQPASLTILHTYNRHLPASHQPPSIPHTFLDSLTVRETVFVHEQENVPLVHHIDTDDARCYHWVLYSLEKKPIGTVRLVPFPHHPRPSPGARFEAPGKDDPVEDSSTFFSIPPPEYRIEPATSLHDGKELYIKLGRLCVVKEFRGKNLADLLIQAALEWARGNPDFGEVDGRKWEGLVCAHAQEGAVGVWARNGLVVDEGMGRWFEAGIVHVGMWRRVELGKV
jgi:predicted GNAT family N-acyltransferase